MEEKGSLRTEQRHVTFGHKCWRGRDSAGIGAGRKTMASCRSSSIDEQHCILDIESAEEGHACCHDLLMFGHQDLLFCKVLPDRLDH